jgi:putative phosphoribosyl transferase
MALVCRFQDRKSAGRALAERLEDLATVTGPAIVLAVPPNGVAVAAPIARALGAALDVAWVRKVVRPREPDVVLGAVDLDGDVLLNPEAVKAEGLDNELVTELAYHTHRRLAARAGDARDRLRAALRGRTVVIVDDGLTTGLTLISALRWARRHGAGRCVVAVPVVDRRIWQRVAEHADDAVTLEERPDGPIARSDVYDNFRRIHASTAARLLNRQQAALAGSHPGP